MSKRIATVIAGLTTLAILGGCAAEPPYRGDCYGNNCRHGYEREHYVVMNEPAPTEGVRAAA